MKKIAMSLAAVATLALPIAGAGAASAGEPAAPDKGSASTSDNSPRDFQCQQSGSGTKNNNATCYNITDQARYAHFHVDCWAWGDNDRDLTKWVGPKGSVSFYHYCWSYSTSIEAYYN